MLFRAKADCDRASQVLIDVGTLGKLSKTPMTRIFVDFKVEPLLLCVNSQGMIYGKNPLTNEQGVRDNLDELKLDFRGYRSQVFARGNHEATVSGLCEVKFDLPTQSIWIKSNTLGMTQMVTPNTIYANYLAYMLHFRQLKNLDENGQPAKPNANGKTKNYYKREHELFKIGYMPLAVMSKTDDYEMRQALLTAIESTPLIEGMLTENAYDVRGRALEDYQTYWVSKRAAYKFLESVRPGIYAQYGYQCLTLKIVLATLLEWAGLLDTAFFEAEYNTKLPQLPPLQQTAFNMCVSPDDLSLRRMEPVMNLEINQ